MRSNVNIKEGYITSKINLPDGMYEIDVREKEMSKSYEQVKKLWATIDDISKHEYGDTSESKHIYFQILNMAGIDTAKLLVPEKALPYLQKKFRATDVISHEVINHTPHAIVNVCYKGLSEMSKREASSVIETAIKWCNEIGINTDLNGGETWY